MLQEFYYHEEIHEQAIAMAHIARRPHSIWKDQHFCMPRIQPVRNYWRRLPIEL